MRYRIIPVTPLQQNCTLFWCEKTQRAAVIDPGGDVPVILAELNHLGLTAERILLTDSRRLSVSRRIIELLKSNKIVGITATQGGAQTVATPALGGEIRVATGAPHFALRTHATLLPVFSFRDETGFVVEVQEPIEMVGADRQAAYQSAVEEYARRLDHYVQKYPACWNGWDKGSYTETKAAKS